MYDDEDEEEMEYDEEDSRDHKNWLWVSYDDEGEWYDPDVDPYS